jgi:hypothetical protein
MQRKYRLRKRFTIKENPCFWPSIDVFRLAYSVMVSRTYNVGYWSFVQRLGLVGVLVMKRKSLFIRDESLLKWHAVIYIAFTVALWWSVISTLNYPSNSEIPFNVQGGFIMSRIGATIFWGLFFLLHFVFHQMRSWLQDRARQSHLDDVATIQDRYVPSARLDMDAQNINENEIIDERVLHAAHQERQNGRSR